MFRRAGQIQYPVTISFEGQQIEAEDGETLAAALLAAGVSGFRQATEDDTKRGPYCMIGNCFECMVEIEDHGSRQACRERVRDGLVVRRHQGSAR